MSHTDDPEGIDLRIEVEKSDAGLKSVTITALMEQGEIDLAMEYPRIVKLLQRDWGGEAHDD